MMTYMKADAVRLGVLAQAFGAATLYVLALAAAMHQVALAAGL